MNDREGATRLVKGKSSKRVKKIWADMGYRGKQLKDFMKIKGKDLEIVQRLRKWVRVTQEQIYSIKLKLGVLATSPVTHFESVFIAQLI